MDRFLLAANRPTVALFLRFGDTNRTIEREMGGIRGDGTFKIASVNGHAAGIAPER